LGEVILSADQVIYYNNGNSARLLSSIETEVSVGEQVRVYSPQERLFLGVGVVEEGHRVQPKRVVVRPPVIG
jgi:hypothetical protein